MSRPAPSCPTSPTPTTTASRPGSSRPPAPGPTASHEALNAECGEERAAELLRRYGHVFPEGYKADHSPRAAVADLVHLEALKHDEQGLRALACTSRSAPAPGERRFKIYRTGEQVSLSAVLPVLQRLGVEVVDERPYELRCADRTHAWIYDFGLRMPQVDGSGDYLADDARERFQDAFAAVWTGEAENDGFNSLVLRRRSELAAGDGAARLREVPAPGRFDLQPGLHGGHPP